MAGVATDLQRRTNQRERQVGRWLVADDLRVRFERLEHQIDGRGFAGRRHPLPDAGFQGGLLLGALVGVLLGAGLDQLLARQSRQVPHQAAQEADLGLISFATALVGLIHSEAEAQPEPWALGATDGAGTQAGNSI
jgi:hypothetical protein